MCFGSRGPSLMPWLRHRSELTERDWENAVQGIGKVGVTNLLRQRGML